MERKEEDLVICGEPSEAFQKDPSKVAELDPNHRGATLPGHKETSPAESDAEKGEKNEPEEDVEALKDFLKKHGLSCLFSELEKIPPVVMKENCVDDVKRFDFCEGLFCDVPEAVALLSEKKAAVRQFCLEEFNKGPVAAKGGAEEGQRARRAVEPTGEGSLSSALSDDLNDFVSYREFLLRHDTEILVPRLEALEGGSESRGQPVSAWVHVSGAKEGDVRPLVPLSEGLETEEQKSSLFLELAGSLVERAEDHRQMKRNPIKENWSVPESFWVMLVEALSFYFDRSVVSPRQKRGKFSLLAKEKGGKDKEKSGGKGKKQGGVRKGKARMYSDFERFIGDWLWEIFDTGSAVLVGAFEVRATASDCASTFLALYGEDDRGILLEKLREYGKQGRLSASGLKVASWVCPFFRNEVCRLLENPPDAVLREARRVAAKWKRTGADSGVDPVSPSGPLPPLLRPPCWNAPPTLDAAGKEGRKKGEGKGATGEVTDRRAVQSGGEFEACVKAVELKERLLKRENNGPPSSSLVGQGVEGGPVERETGNDNEPPLSDVGGESLPTLPPAVSLNSTSQITSLSCAQVESQPRVLLPSQQHPNLNLDSSSDLHPLGQISNLSGSSEKETVEKKTPSPPGSHTASKPALQPPPVPMAGAAQEPWGTLSDTVTVAIPQEQLRQEEAGTQLKVQSNRAAEGEGEKKEKKDKPHLMQRREGVRTVVLPLI
uniref:Uncharacterized protein n=1 Tax=Chromera velia CCMP2878 TaxID=1169474 RepID=A0A0G4HIL3_9ALVE|eukprot:Cvel_27835.t1-p1 / transcript=Cvel_27835.t1 / gene=Cvel_27835 / organism=Chromera_velia_CCMP2878 / gene_product=hypothetical protein / transcript_product=hypothetical protein / location=Cvel_scaffold3539:2632-7862(+) / protein_length=717 / sequence_SO=supercontig / SO=protein_coding / is_pseudo=false